MKAEFDTIVKTLLTLIEKKKYTSIKDILVTLQAADVALIFDELQEESLPILFRLLPKEQAAETFVEMDENAQELLIRSFSDSELKAVLDEMYVDDAVDLVEEMPANVVKRILRQADAETRKQINEILKYPEDSAGSIMTTEYVSLRPKMTIAEAIKRIRRVGVDKETINNCYVTNDGRVLLGQITIQDIILAGEDELVSDVMDENIIFATTVEDREIVAQNFTKYGLLTMPVVDEENRLVGIVTSDDVMDVIKEEATEDIEIMGAITPVDKPYLKTGVFETFKSRIPWLLLLMISATFTGIIITHFEDALAAQMALSAFIPMLMDTGGNSGSQASVTIIRGISLGEIEFRDMPIVIWKEIRVAFFCSVVLGLANFAKIMLFDRLIMGNSDITFTVAAVICLTLVFTVCIAKLVGCTLPMLAKKVGFDPAVMASPFITTIVDAISLFIYFRFATLILGL
ncbi:MAG: magnesium transporter [Oscillospiraceae bacterium]|nr:magnesium transporter [Oscillospiraceae bacterium]